MRISDWISDVCSSDLVAGIGDTAVGVAARRREQLGEVGRAFGAGILDAELKIVDRPPAETPAIGEDGADRADVIVRDPRREIEIERPEKGLIGDERDLKLGEDRKSVV